MNEKRTQVMIVEDEGVVALDIRKHLEKFGYNITGIHPSGEEAVERFPSEKPDLVLMDIRLQGDLDGLETAQILKQRRLVPIILLTAYADERTVERAKTIEPFGYIIKPFEERELRTSIEMALYRHRLEQQLQNSEERYRRFFMDDLSADFVADGEGNFIACNDAFVNTFGYADREEAEEGSLADLLHDGAAREELLNELVSNRKLEFKEIELRRRDDRPILLLANIVGSFDGEDRLQEIKGYLVDISKRRDLEKRLRQAQKLEAIGRLAGGVSHDFNNILTVIIGYSTMMREKLNRGDMPTLGDISGIEDAARRASTLTRQLLAFSRRQVLKPKNVNLNELVRNIEKMIRRLIHESIAMKLDLSREKDLVWVDPGQVEQVLINLVVNARDAMPEGGTITIRTNRKRLESPMSSRMGMIPEGEYVLLSVSDTGHGIDEETLSLIFEPFFTTKPEEKGTGLGLSTVYGIVRQSDGYISLDTELNTGTVFTVYFPASTELEEEKPSQGTSEEQIEGDEQVLVVEDEDSVRRLTKHILERYGYEVRVASDPLEALELCRGDGARYDLLVTDMVMPHMEGTTLAGKVRELNRNIRILYMSGYPQYNQSREDTTRPAFEDHIAKPFDPTTFIRKVRALLDS